LRSFSMLSMVLRMSSTAVRSVFSLAGRITPLYLVVRALPSGGCSGSSSRWWTSSIMALEEEP
jgi:hypothetical protein